LFKNDSDNNIITIIIVFWGGGGRNSPQWVRASSFTRLLGHTQRRTTVSRPLLDEWSARRRDFYLTTHNTRDKHHALGGIRTHNPSKRGPADLRFRPRGHWDRQLSLPWYDILFKVWKLLRYIHSVG
jgi:hypothetical protein